MSINKTNQDKFFIDEIYRNIDRINIPYLSKICEAEDFKNIPCVLITPSGKVRYINEILKDIEFEFPDQTPLLTKILYEGEYLDTTLEDYLRNYLNGISSSNITDSTKLEIIFQLNSYFEILEKNKKEVSDENDKKGPYVKDLKVNIEDIKWRSYPIYLFGIPRAGIVYPIIPDTTSNTTSNIDIFIEASIVPLTVTLEKIIWDIFVDKVFQTIKENPRRDIAEIVKDNFNILCPEALLNSKDTSDSPLFDKNEIGEYKLPIPKGDDLKKILTDNQKNLIAKIEQYKKIFEETKRKILQETINSAIAAILTESYAHNIGAHAIEGLKMKLSEQWDHIRNLLEKKGQSILFCKTELLNNMVLSDKFDKDIKDIVKTHADFIEYLNYLQGKSAFWSAIPRYGYLIGGKHSNIWDIINDFGKNNLLCGSIGASEGYKGINFFIEYYDDNCYKTVDLGISEIGGDLRYRFEEEDLTGNNYWDNYKGRMGTQVQGEGTLNNLREALQKMEVFLPEGVVGQQAIYTIWENIIRNVKHCKKNGEYIPFHIKIEEEDNKIKITSWLDLEPVKQNNDLENKIKYMNKWDGILNKYNKPNMSGTSQNILCAGLIYGLTADEVEKRQISDTDKVMEFQLSEDNRFLFSFKIWKSGKDISYNTIKGEKDIGPLGRFKFIKFEDDAECNKFLSENAFLLRYVVSSDANDLYSKWIKEWIKTNKNFKIENVEITYDGKTTDGNSSSDTKTTFGYYLYHREPQCKTKKGVLIPFKNTDCIGKIVQRICYKDKDAFYELVEILETKIEIFDQRLYNLSLRFAKNDLEAINIFVYPEELPQTSENACGEQEAKYHFGVFHLSFLERQTSKKNGEAIIEFFTNPKAISSERYRFIVITTGRGRDWWNEVKGKEEVKKLAKKIIYIPIENLENCFEQSILYTPKVPHVGVKYAIVKTIFGS